MPKQRQTEDMSTSRTPHQRQVDTLAVLQRQGSGWLATADTDATPHVIAVAALWTGDALVVTTRDGTPTARNLDAGGRARLILGTTDDVIMIDTTVSATQPSIGADPALVAAFVAATGWDPAEEGPDWRYFTLLPTRIQAYRGYGELGGHVLMQDGLWGTAS